MLADSEESVESDEEFYFVDDSKIPTRKKNNLPSAGVKPNAARVMVTLKGSEEGSATNTEIPSSNFSEDFNITQPDDFARMMTTFNGFDENITVKDKENDRKRSLSYKNKLFAAAHEEDGHMLEKSSQSNETLGSNSSSGIGEGDTDQTGCINIITVSDNGTGQNSDITKSVAPSENNGLVQNHGGKSSSSLTSSQQLSDKDGDLEKRPDDCNSDNQNIDGDGPEDGNASQSIEGFCLKANAAVENGINSRSLRGVGNEESVPSSINMRCEDVYQPGKDESTSSHNPQNNSNSSETQETYITVLPSTSEQPDENVTEKSNDVNLESESDQDVRFSKTGKSRSRCLSYVVVSGGEGHVDLRLRVKSKQDLKKDAQSMFLIWRVNSKI